MEVNGEKIHPLYTYLRTNSSLYNSKTRTSGVIAWNFAKFLITPDGTVIKYFPPQVHMNKVVAFIETHMESS